VEDCDPKAADHLGDATRYVLTGIGAGPEFTILDDNHEIVPGQVNELGVEVLRDTGAYAWRPSADDLWAAAEGLSDDDPAARRAARTVRVVGREGGR
jgi:hypothetical protein